MEVASEVCVVRKSGMLQRIGCHSCSHIDLFVQVICSSTMPKRTHWDPHYIHLWNLLLGGGNCKRGLLYIHNLVHMIASPSSWYQKIYRNEIFI